MPSRVSAHVIEEQSKDYVRMKINANGNMIFRELTGRDYGIDAIVELFEDEMPTGKICFLQIKATQKTIVPLCKIPDYVSCPNVSISNLNYSFQNNIPVVLIYISLKGEKGFYYTVLNNNKDNDIKGKTSQNTTSIRIPIQNYISMDVKPLTNIIKEFYV